MKIMVPSLSASSHFLRLSVDSLKTQNLHALVQPPDGVQGQRSDGQQAASCRSSRQRNSSRCLERHGKPRLANNSCCCMDIVPQKSIGIYIIKTTTLRIKPVANRVRAVPVAAKPGQWLGAGGSMIVESDKQSGSATKQYIGMVSMLDVVAHIAGDESENELDKKMVTPVSSLIGHCPEGLSLWSLNPSTSIMDCMEMLSKGIHRVLVPLDSNIENIRGPELVESASAYAMLTQMDLISFFLDRFSDLQGILSQTIKDLSAIHDTVLALTSQARVKDAVKCMSMEMLNALPIVEALSEEEDHQQLVDGRNRRVVGTFSASDLKGCHLATLRSWLPLNALVFAEKIPRSPLFAPGRELVTCHVTSTLAHVIHMVTTKRVHRVWVVDQNDGLKGLVSLTDIIAAVRSALLAGAQDL